MEDIQAQATKGPCERGDQVCNPLYSRSIRSVIQGDEQYPGTEKYRQRIEECFRQSVFTSKKRSAVTPAQLEARGEFRTVCFKEKKGAVADSCKAARAVGVRGKTLQEILDEFINRGFVLPCSDKMDWVSRAFLVPKPNGKWQLVIDYRWLNSQLEGYNFPLQVIEDQIAKQRGRFFNILVDLEDGFHQMRLAQESQPLTAFVTPFGTYMPTVLPMGVKVGPQVFQRMVQHVLRNCMSESGRYIDDVLSSTGKPPPEQRGKGKMMDSHAYCDSEPPLPDSVEEVGR